MATSSASKRWYIPLFLSGILLILHGFPLPAPVRDAATGAWVPDFHLTFPRWHVLFSPFMGIADLLTVLSLHQLILTAAYVFVVIGMLWRRWKALAATGFFLLFVAWGALIPRPMGRLIASDPNVLLIDFHSHSQYSHDGRKRWIPFTPERNMRWHERQGFNAGFITDHNRVEASQQAKALSRQTWQETGYRSLEGEEVSLWKTHLVALGVHERIDNQPYDSDEAKIAVFVRDMRARNILVIASLPEYWLYHWGGGVQQFVDWGMNGFEIINSAPKALDFPLSKRREIMELCREHHLAMTGITDNHGYGYATAVWNAMVLPGWQALGPDPLEARVLQELQRSGFTSVRVLERAVYRPESPIKLLLSPLVNLLWYFRLLQTRQLLDWVGWIWGVWWVSKSLIPRLKRV